MPSFNEYISVTSSPFNIITETTAQQATINAMKKVARGIKPAPQAYDHTVPLKPKKDFSFGCDPEGFVFDPTGQPVPAAGIIPGTKYKPYPVKKGAVQVDGMAAEFNIDPVDNYKDWETNITTVVKELHKFLPKGHTIKWVPSVRFPEDKFDAAPDENKELGCMPDFNAWNGSVNPPPRPEDPYVRCAGGHLHFGWTKDEDLTDLQHLMNCQDLGKQLDWFLGGWSVYHDSDTVRRGLYGKMGAIRYKPYGVEYRVLSNFWLNSKELRLATWNRMVKAVECMNNIYVPDRVPRGMLEVLANAINSSKSDPNLSQLTEFPVVTLDINRCRL